MVLEGFKKKGVSEVINGKLFFAIFNNDDRVPSFSFPTPVIFFNVHKQFRYEPFYADFGPLNLSCTYRFCVKLRELIKDGEASGCCVCFCSNSDPKKKSNAAVLLGSYLVMFEDYEAEVAYNPLAQFGPYLPFRDPTRGRSMYNLSVLDCIRAVSKAKKIGWIDFNNFNVEEYELYEKIENGDMNWIVPRKIIAFRSPATTRMEMHGYQSLVPEDYVDYFKQMGVTTVIRLNMKTYDKQSFTDHGFSFYDLHFPDGSCPPESILWRFLEIIECAPCVVAVHCKAGLGRTGVLIGCYIMKHLRFTANEVLGYLRIVRPGSVIGPQQLFLQEMQPKMWKAGELRFPTACNNKNIRKINFSSSGYYAQGGLNLMPMLNPSLPRTIQTGAQMNVDSKGLTKYPANHLVRKTRLGCFIDSDKTDSFIEKSDEADNTPFQSTEKSQEEACRQSYRCSSSPIYPKPRKVEGSTATYEGSCSIVVSKSSLYKQNSCPYDFQTAQIFHWNDDGKGIMRKANSHCKTLSSECCTKRVVNSAGQPRKVMVPISQVTWDFG